MTTLATDAPLVVLAQILRAAQLLGPDSWGGDDSGGFTPSTGSEAELSLDLLELFSLLNNRKIPYLLVGGVALPKYVDGRNTQDIDLLISLNALQNVPEIVVSDRNVDFARGRFRSLRVDLLMTENPLFKIVEEQFAATHRFREIDVRSASVEGLLLLKLYALPSLYRQGNGQRIALYEADITMLLQRYSTPVEPLLNILATHVDPDAHRELAYIVVDIQNRIQRMNRLRPKP